MMNSYSGLVAEFARRQHKAPLDSKFNEGRRDCLMYNPYSEAARYFLVCTNYRKGD